MTHSLTPAGKASLAAAPGPAEPWIETREGMLFFVNALFVIPEYCVLFPLGLRTLLKGLGQFSHPSVFLDTLPTFATHFLPYVGWVLLVPIALVFKNFQLERGAWRRAVLVVFLISHVAFLGYTVRLWFAI